MATAVKVSFFVILSYFAFSCAHLVTFEGAEADANKEYKEEVIVQSTLFVRDKDSRKGRDRSHAVAGDSGSLILNRPKRSPQYSNFPYAIYPPYNQQPYVQGAFGDRQFQSPINGLQGDYGQSRYPGYQQQQPGFQPLGYQQQQLGPQPPVIPSVDTSLSNTDTHSFLTNTPYGKVGSSSSDTQSQGFTADGNGIRGGVAIGGNQEYKLPFGLTLSVNYADGFNVNNNGANRAGSNSVVLRDPNGQPINF